MANNVDHSIKSSTFGQGIQLQFFHKKARHLLQIRPQFRRNFAVSDFKSHSTPLSSQQLSILIFYAGDSPHKVQQTIRIGRIL